MTSNQESILWGCAIGAFFGAITTGGTAIGAIAGVAVVLAVSRWWP